MNSEHDYVGTYFRIYQRDKNSAKHFNVMHSLIMKACMYPQVLLFGCMRAILAGCPS